MGITKNIGFKLSTYKVLSFFTQDCAKKLVHNGLILEKMNQNSGLYSKYLWNFQNNANIAPISEEKSVFPKQEIS